MKATLTETQAVKHQSPITTVYTTENSFTECITLETILRQLKMNEG